MSYLPVGTQLLFELLNADMQSTADQQFTKAGSFTNWIMTEVMGLRTTGGTTVACLGGIYSGASKTGSIILPAATSWIGLSGGSKYVRALDPLNINSIQTATPYLSLSTGSTGACTAKIQIYGRILD